MQIDRPTVELCREPLALFVEHVRQHDFRAFGSELLCFGGALSPRSARYGHNLVLEFHDPSPAVSFGHVPRLRSGEGSVFQIFPVIDFRQKGIDHHTHAVRDAAACTFPERTPEKTINRGVTR
jgi:hypothetical protein